MEAALEAEAPADFVPRGLGDGRPLTREELRTAAIRSLPRPALLDAPITELRGVGDGLAGAASELGIATLGDLLRHLPRDYRDRASVVGLGELKLGEEATVQVEVLKGGRARPTRRRRLTVLEIKVADQTGAAKAVWFNRGWLAERLQPGTRLLLRGKLERRGFTVSEHELLDRSGNGAPAGLHTTGLVPLHPATERLRAQRIREWVWQARPLARHAVEPLPARARAQMGLPRAADALIAAHFPRGAHEVTAARRRLAFEELFVYQAALASRRSRRRRVRAALALPPSGELVDRWIASLPFPLTGDQQRAIEEIDADLARRLPMQRLLMGEVGSGKTVVCVAAMLRAIEGGAQAALMAPTETLAEQHFRTLRTLLGGEPVPIALLTGATGLAERRRVLRRLAEGRLPLVAGTHALLEPDVAFRRLAVAVVDEQHRFGVRQRAALDAKGPDDIAPHALHMTATPIPRTLSLTAYGDLDATTLRELPQGRRPIRTWVVDEEGRPGAYELLRERLREGRQAYVVCPLVSESDDARVPDRATRVVQSRAAEAEVKRLAAGELRGFRLDVLHGQMRSARKAEVMSRFAAGEVDVLVATSVVEVGIDVPNATVMVVEGAERYGLSQLHQLRGRVGRGDHGSVCILFGDPDSEAARARLEAISSERDGFELAEIDLAIRGEGEIMGTRQHGMPRFGAASLPEDLPLLLEARALARRLIDRHGSLEQPFVGPLMDEARRRFGDERIAP